MATFLHFSHPFLSFMLHCDTHCPSRVLQMRARSLPEAPWPYRVGPMATRWSALSQLVMGDHAAANRTRRSAL